MAIQSEALSVARTPVRPFEGPGALWIKDDGQTHPLYGGNKPRKLARSLREAADRGARRVIAVGAAGSHHVLASALFAPRFGLEVLAVIAPQPFSEHAEQVLRGTLATGAEVVAASDFARIGWHAARRWRRGDHFLQAGGSTVAATLAYADAVDELDAAARSAERWYVAVGSGGTAAGLLAGVVRRDLPVQIVGVSVATPGAAARALVLSLAARALARSGRPVPLARLAARLVIDDRERGAGYGHATLRGQAASELAAASGLSLDPTYTSKAFAAAHDRALLRKSSRSGPRVLYWHTLSSAPPPLRRELAAFPPEFARLLVRPAGTYSSVPEVFPLPR